MTSQLATDCEMADRPDLWCAIPVYNNHATIRDIAERARAQCARVMVIDDGSTGPEVAPLLAGLDVVLLKHDQNLGKGAAILTALRYAASHQGEYLITIDGDGQHFPEDLPRFIQRLEPHTILIGHRDQVVGQMPQISQFGRDFSDFWINLETGACPADTQSGFRAYPVQDVLALPLCSRRYNFEVEVVTRALWAGLSIQKAPIRVWYPPSAERVSSFRPFLDNLRISLMHSRLVGRQLLPIPHRRLARASAVAQGKTSWPWRLLAAGASPLALAAGACAAVSLGTMPAWWCRALAIAYVCARLHLNALLCLVLLGLSVWPVLPRACLALGQWVLPGGGHAELLQWFVGSLLVAPMSGVLAALLTYQIASRLRKPRAAAIAACEEPAKTPEPVS